MINPVSIICDIINFYLPLIAELKSHKNGTMPEASEGFEETKHWRHYLKTDPDPIAIVIRVVLFTHRPSETNRNWHCMVTHARLV